MKRIVLSVYLNNSNNFVTPCIDNCCLLCLIDRPTKVDLMHYVCNNRKICIHLSSVIYANLSRTGGRLNIKMPSYQYRDPHVKDKTVSQTVLSLTWESPHLGKTVFILKQGPGRWAPYDHIFHSKLLVAPVCVVLQTGSLLCGIPYGQAGHHMRLGPISPRVCKPEIPCTYK